MADTDKKVIRLTTYNGKEQVYPQITLADKAVEDTLSIAHGGTGASDAAGARKNLGLEYGVNIPTLGSDAKIQSSYLPSYVDDVIEGYVGSDVKTFYTSKDDSGNLSGSVSAESGKIYVDLSDNKTYRWSGSQLTVISDTIALGRTSGTAFPGDAGKQVETDIATLTSKVDGIPSSWGLTLGTDGHTVTIGTGGGSSVTVKDSDTQYGLGYDETSKVVTLTTNGTAKSVKLSGIDTHYKTGIVAGISGGNANVATENGKTFVNVTDDGSVSGGIGIAGNNEIDVSSDNNGNVTIKDNYEPYTEAELEAMWVGANVGASEDDYGDMVYGVEWDVNVSSPACTRVGNLSLHKSLPIQSGMRGCLLNDDGSVASYLPEDDWTGSVRDGSAGQVMVEIPEHWRLGVTSGSKRRIMMSMYAVPGYLHVPKMYVSAYEAALDRTNLKLASVVNTTEQYRGGNNNADYDGTGASLLGMPATNLSRINFRKYARNRNTATTEWNCMTYDLQKTLYWLFVVEYATLNSQAAYNAELTSEGYQQGGLGAGVTTISYKKWHDFNVYNPFVPCGYTDELGNGTGVKDFTMPTEYDSGNTKVVSVPRYRGVENPFGHIWQWTDGINVRMSPTTDNGGDDLSKVFVCSDPAKFSNTGYDGYSLVGNEARKEGYVKELIFGEGGEIMPKEVGGGSTTYICDYHYTNIPTSSEALYGLLFGGVANYGAYAGFASALSAYAPSNTSTYIGSRLCFIAETA